MATKKRTKARAKPKKKKKSVARKPARRTKPAARKTTKKTPKKIVRKKTTARPRPKKPAARKTPAARPRPATAAAPTVLTTPPPGGVRIGVVTHYYSHLSVAIIRMESGSLREGDFIHIKGHTTDFSQRVESMELDHVHVSEVRPGESFGLKVKDHAREHDVVYKVAAL